jgi:CO/xanthine dehydrogenase FAD-binding subunit
LWWENFYWGDEMKTFKLISLQVVTENELMDITLDDGLIINKEDEAFTWLIEAYTKRSNFDFFQKVMKENKELVVQVIITKMENDPAPLKVKVRSVTEFDDNISVLLEGKLKRSKNKYAELILQDLIQRGMNGEELLAEFKTRMQNRNSIFALKSSVH